MKKIIFALIMIIPLIYAGCKKEDDPIQLVASAGDSQTVKPQVLITLNGTNSTGPDGFTYTWTYSGLVAESEINFQNTTSANPTFTPPIGAVYTFTLTTNSGDQTSSDQVTIVASGGIEIGGTLSSDLALVDIEPDAGVPDYIVTSDLVVPQGITLSVADENVVVYFESETGLHITDGGKLTNLLEGNEDGLNIAFIGDENNGWKGIWVENSTIELNHASIKNGGKQKFEELSEPASLILSGAQTDLISIDGNKIENSFSYDVMVPDQIGGEGYFKNNDLSFKNPVKAHITFLNFYISNYPNLYPEDHEYNIFIPSGSDKMDIVDRSFRFSGGKFYIDGDFWAGSIVGFSNCTIYMRDGAGLLAEAGFTSTSTEMQGNIIITGLDGAHWKGIAAISNSFYSMAYTTIENAGYGIIEMGDFTAETNATLYSTAEIGSIENCNIINGGGYGYYYADIINQNVSVSVTGNEFKNLQKAAIRTNVAAVSRLFFGLGGSNTFDLPPDVPAILVEGDGSPSLNWIGLGEGNFYLIDAEITTGLQDGFTLDEGAHLKFSSGHSYIYNPPAGGLSAPVRFLGSAENPVILEGEVDAPGSWGGIYMGVIDHGYMEIRHCIIKNGGEFVLPNATEKANFSFFYTGFESHMNIFNNSTFSGSAGYGIVVETESYNPEFDAPEKNNEFYDNALGDILIK